MQLHSLGNFFGQNLSKIWENWGEIWAKCGQIWAKFGQIWANQNLASPKALDLLRLCCEAFIIQVFAQWRGNYFWTGGARPIRAPKSGTRNKGLRWNWERFFVPKTSVLQKKGLLLIWSVSLSRKQAFSKKKRRSSPDLERFLVPKMAQDVGLRGGKSRPGGAKIFPGEAAAPLLPAPMYSQVVEGDIKFLTFVCV